MRLVTAVFDHRYTFIGHTTGNQSSWSNYLVMGAYSYWNIVFLRNFLAYRPS